MSRAPRVCGSAKDIVTAMEGYGFQLDRINGRGHLIFTKPGLKGCIVTSNTPRSAQHVCKRIKSDIKRLMAAQGAM